MWHGLLVEQKRAALVRWDGVRWTWIDGGMHAGMQTGMQTGA
jgi:hypothetical protein